MNDAISDARVLTQIQHLVNEEHALFERSNLGQSESERLAAIQIELDQCWDVLRQRRALRETGRDPTEAHVRPADIVEKYVG